MTDGSASKYYNNQNFLFKVKWSNYKVPDIVSRADSKKMQVLNRRFPKTKSRYPLFEISGGLRVEDYKSHWITFIREILDSRFRYKQSARELVTIYNHKKIAAKNKYPDLNDQQEAIVKTVVECKEFTTFILRGRAGSGKTFILSRLQDHFQTTYISIGQNLCSHVKKNFPRVETWTLCKFLMKFLNMNYITTTGIFQDMIKHLPFDWMDDEEQHFDTLGLFSAKRPNLIFIDEFSLLHDGLIGLIYNIIKYISREYQTVLIFAGDSNQIFPKYQTETAAGLSTDSINILKMNCIDRELTSQHRIDDPEYDKFLTSIFTCDDIVKHVQKMFPPLDLTIEYEYPYGTILNMPTSEGELCDWMRTFNPMVPIFLTYTNREMQFYNMSMSYKILNDLKIHKLHDTDLDIDKFIRFDLPFNKDRQGIREQYMSEIPLITPLIVGMPYKILSYQTALPRLEIVILTSLEDGFVKMYCPSEESVINVYPMTFYSNFKKELMFGIPIQLQVGETFFSSQGLTLTRDIYCNFNGATLEEMYVAMSRAKKKYYKGIYI